MTRVPFLDGGYRLVRSLLSLRIGISSFFSIDLCNPIQNNVLHPISISAISG